MSPTNWSYVGDLLVFGIVESAVSILRSRLVMLVVGTLACFVGVVFLYWLGVSLAGVIWLRRQRRAAAADEEQLHRRRPQAAAAEGGVVNG